MVAGRRVPITTIFERFHNRGLNFWPESGKVIRRRLERRFDSILKKIVLGEPEQVRNLSYARWLLDNSHIVRQTLKQIATDLPPGYRKQLPTQANDDSVKKPEKREKQNTPRIFALVDEAVDQSGLPIDSDFLDQFFSVYGPNSESDEPLTLGEIWAIPTVLRILLLRRLCAAAEACHDQQMLQDDEQADENDTDVTPVAGCIISLRTVATLNWPKFVEHTSQLEKLLRNDPSRVYSKMDFETRDRYRDAIEKISDRSDLTQYEVAQAALKLAEQAKEKVGENVRTAEDDNEDHLQHIGYYLIDKGRKQLNIEVEYRSSLSDKLVALLSAHCSGLYLFAILALSLLGGGLILNQLLEDNMGVAASISAAVLVLIPLISVSSQAVNFLCSLFIPPRPLAKMDFSTGIPELCQSIVVVPMLLSSVEEIDKNLLTLEHNYLGNTDRQLRFALLSDFTDADSEKKSEDQTLLNRAISGIDGLNERYGKQGLRPFYLFHRRRQWNDNAAKWMGWERKRGKLEEFNALLRGSQTTSYDLQHGDTDFDFERLKYVITLDADSYMPVGTAAKLVGILAHPLNRPRFDKKTGSVTDGYTIIQPRLETNPVSGADTVFSRIFAGDVLLDLYTNAVSDTYQDVFGEAIFAGKGIYDLDAFSRTLTGKVPENSVLSHDLLEGLYGRAALASDTVLLENYPPNYAVYLKRLHRWIRGDWQLLPWLFKQKSVDSKDFCIGVIGRWKLFDNMRRSLVMPAIFLLLVLGWVALPNNFVGWTLLFALLPGLPILLRVTLALRTNLWRWGTIRSSARNLATRMGEDASRWFLALVFLPAEAYVCLDAALRTTYRVAISHKKLLEWSAAAEVSRAMGKYSTAIGVWKTLWFGPMAAIVIYFALFFLNPDALNTATGFLFVWLFSPFIALTLGRQIQPRKIVPIGNGDKQLLRNIARDTWRFFERYIGPDTHWLPPDNIQEYPKLIVAERTSPTNIGMMLLSTLTAYDMGYLGQRQLLTRMTNHIDSIRRLRKYRGHLLNWYSTRDLSPLEPLYVSTVDSGNFVASLIVLRQALKEMPEQPQPMDITILALSDELMALRKLIFHDKFNDFGDGEKIKLVKALDAAQAVFSSNSNLLDNVHQFEQYICSEIEQAFLDVVDAHPDWWSAEEIANFRQNSQVFRQHIRMVLADIRLFSPWLEMLSPPSLSSLPGLSEYRPQLEKLASNLPMLGDDGDPNESLDAATRDIDSLLAKFGEPKPGSNEYSAAQWLRELNLRIKSARAAIEEVKISRERLILMLSALIESTNFAFLYDTNRHLFRVGYNASTGEDDNSYYDLLASEARIASFVAIANGDVPAKHWVQLGRPLTRIRGLRILLSWSATAFEYLMPRLIMHSPSGALLAQSNEGAVQEQIRFGHKHNIPWGISESGYAQLDAQNHYQYYAFGIPKLGLKWDQGERLVVSSYASLLSLPYAPKEVVSNLQKLVDLGARGDCGLYEALDFGDAHKRRPSRPRVVQSYMAHHQGMILVAIGNALHEDETLKRFHRDPEIASIEYLLYEQLPQRMQTRPLERLPSLLKDLPSERANVSQWLVAPDQAELAVLSNGRLSSRISNQGGSALYWRGQAVTRWDSLGSGAGSGSFTYLKDLDNQRIYSLGPEPLPKSVEVVFAPHSAEFRARQNDLLIRMRLMVAPSADVEIRRISITNDSAKNRSVQLCSYAEPVLGDEKADRRHTTFSKLFLESQFLEHEDVLLFRRRPRDSNQPSIYFANCAVIPEHCEISRKIETDRLSFLGRNGNPAQPAALTDPRSETRISMETSSTLDPCAAIISTLDIPARSTIECAFLSSVADSRAAAIDALKPFKSLGRVEWTIEAARMYSERELTGLRIDSKTVRESFKLLSTVIWPGALPHVSKDAFYNTRRVQDTLWRHGISGDLPIVTMRIDDEADLDAAETLLRCLNFLSHKDVLIDLVFLDKTKGGYSFPISDRLRKLVDTLLEPNRKGGHSHGFILPVQNISPIEISDLIAAARIFVNPNRRSSKLSYADANYQDLLPMPAFVPQPSAPLSDAAIEAVSLQEDLLFKNHIGGMLADLSGYCMLISNKMKTPAPWCNVLANPDFGSLISESGSMCTWWGNSSENRLTPWNNDAVLDKTGEAIYLRDEETGNSWSLTPLPRPDDLPYRVTHSIGESLFEHNSQGLEQRLQVFVDSEKPLKVMRIRLVNKWPRVRRLTVTFAVEWLIGNSFSYERHLLVSERDEETGALMVRNAFPRHSQEELAFIASDLPAHSVSCDGREFFGKAWSWEAPAGLASVGLSDRVEPSSHPCGVYQVHVELQEEQVLEFHFVLGAAENLPIARKLIAQASNIEWVEERHRLLMQGWERILGTWAITTPDIATDAMINKWLLYQVVSSRLWGRIGFYQASGGFGFRDQLQDVLALLDTSPEIAREQILMAASRQFGEGDVLHWWHENPLRGVRTRISDDLLWLPYAVAEYIDVTADSSILNTKVAFLEGEPLSENESERYAEYLPGSFSAGIYEHCCRAIDARVAFGSHGMPLIGTGDWNDGLDRVGEKGQGESVWMAWFLSIVCRRFASICRLVEDDGRADHYQSVGAELLDRTKKVAWSGDWYLRGYFDDGTPLGAPGNAESEIDLNAQTWAVLADPDDAVGRKAMNAAENRLVDTEHRLIKLLAPPFEKTGPDPGYIRSYPPGVRENGGQYTHAAVWMPWAAAELGNAEQAMRWFDWLNPLKRASSREEIEHYRLEPYVTPGDVYGVGSLTGRGGWSWYTGSAAWLYRLAIRKLLGLQRQGNKLFIRPCLPDSWPIFEATLRYGGTEYQLGIHQPAAIEHDKLFLLENGTSMDSEFIQLAKEGAQDESQTEERSLEKTEPEIELEENQQKVIQIEVFASDSARRDWLTKHSS